MEPTKGVRNLEDDLSLAFNIETSAGRTVISRRFQGPGATSYHVESQWNLMHQTRAEKSIWWLKSRSFIVQLLSHWCALMWITSYVLADSKYITHIAVYMLWCWRLFLGWGACLASHLNDVAKQRLSTQSPTNLPPNTMSGSLMMEMTSTPQPKKVCKCSFLSNQALQNLL